MTNLKTDAPHATAAPAWVSPAGLVCAVAGVLGAASGIFLAVYPAQVSEDMFSYPLTADGFTAIQVWFFVQHLGLAAGLAALAAARVMAPGRAARWGSALAIFGMVLLAVTELIAIGSRTSTYPGEGTDLLDALYGVSSIAAGVGLILAGVAVRRGGSWAGWRRNVVLVAGIFVFVPMTPALMGPFVLARLAITAWMLLFAALGYALWRSGPRELR
jgi:hypothetical protein